MAKVSNREVGDLVNKREQFVTNNETITSSINSKGLYVVYSYGQHFPMYAHDADTNQWFGNSDKYSRTTSRHQSHARPDADIHWTDTDTMSALVNSGSYAAACADRIL